tara:strand:+ start:1395 stop:1604 length:210 start_codon:yes stop_codon:yes gene_type:complete
MIDNLNESIKNINNLIDSHLDKIIFLEYNYNDNNGELTILKNNINTLLDNIKIKGSISKIISDFSNNNL